MDRRPTNNGSFLGRKGTRSSGLSILPPVERPLAPSLRLAHVWTVRSHDATHRARLRILRDYELFFQMECSSWIYSAPDAGSIDLHPGDVAFIPPGFLHGWGHEAGRHLAVHFDLHAQPSVTPSNHIDLTERTVSRDPIEDMPRFLFEEPCQSTVAQPLVLPLVTKLRSPKLWLERLGSLVDLWSARDTESLTASLTAAEVIGWALRTLSAEYQHVSRQRGGRLHAQLLDLVRALDLSSERRPSVRELATRVGVGPTAFRAAFQRALGSTPARYLEGRRIERASRTLVETDLKVAAVAQAAGYQDPYHFSRVFSRVMGVSPREYRRQAGSLGR